MKLYAYSHQCMQCLDVWDALRDLYLQNDGSLRRNKRAIFACNGSHFFLTSVLQSSWLCK